MKVSPIGALIAIVILGITIEVVERESQKAAFALTLVLLLGMITFNAAAFSQQINAIIALANYRPASRRDSPTAAPNRPTPSGGSKFS